MKDINIMVDAHNDTMLKMIDKDTFLPIRDLGMDLDNHINIERLQKGGLNVPFFAAFTPGYFGNYKKDISRTLAIINALYHTQKINSDKLKIIYSLDEIKQNVSIGKIAAVCTIEGAYSIVEANAVELLKQYYDLGVRSMSLTWNYSNELGEGAHKRYNDPDITASTGGLTSLGETIIKEMNNLGMLVDVSHIEEETFWDIIKISRAPIIASHSGVYELKNHSRNLKDKQLLALKDNGGVIGVVLYKSFISDKEEVYVKDFVDHIDYIVNLIGIDHVGIGSDFDGAEMIKDLQDASEIGKIIEELEIRGYSEEDIVKIKYRNFFRVLAKVEGLKKGKKESNIKINNTIKMGEKINNLNFLLRLNIRKEDIKNIDIEKTEIIVDGISYEVNLDEINNTIYAELKYKLKEIFHVITFNIVDNSGGIIRDTKIFYI